MATPLQYDVFKSIYDEEIQRCTDLRNTSKIYLGVCTFLVGSLILKSETFFKCPDIVITKNLFIIAGAFLIIALFFLFLALGVYGYEQLFNPRQEIESFGKEPPEDIDFLDDRLVDIAVAVERNNIQNQKRAFFIKIASILLLLGSTLALSSVLISFHHNP